MQNSEASSGAPSIVQISDTGLRASQCLYTFIESNKSDSAPVAHLAQKVHRMSSLIRNAGDLLNKDSSETHIVSGGSKAVQDCVADCQSIFKEVQDLVAEASKSKHKTLCTRAQGELLEARLDQHNSNLEIILLVLSHSKDLKAALVCKDKPDAQHQQLLGQFRALTLAFKRAKVCHGNLKETYKVDSDEDEDDSECSDSDWDPSGDVRPQTRIQNAAERPRAGADRHSAVSFMTVEKLDSEMDLVLDSLDFFRSQVTLLKDTMRRSEREHLSYIEVMGLKAACAGPTQSWRGFTDRLSRYQYIPVNYLSKRQPTRPIPQHIPRSTMPSARPVPAPNNDCFQQLATMLAKPSHAKKVAQVSPGEQNLDDVEGLLKRWTDVFEVNDKDAFEMVGKEEHK